jgi:hypothetical protein
MGTDPIGELSARIAELERRVDLLFTHAGAIDLEQAARSVPEPSPEVRELVDRGDLEGAVKRYQAETGLGPAEALAALSQLRG